MNRPENTWTRPYVIGWVLAAFVSGCLALICASLAVADAQNIPWANSVGGVNPWNLGSALAAMTGVIVFGLISSTCTIVYALRSSAVGSATARPATPQIAAER